MLGGPEPLPPLPMAPSALPKAFVSGSEFGQEALSFDTATPLRTSGGEGSNLETPGEPLAFPLGVPEPEWTLPTALGPAADQAAPPPSAAALDWSNPTLGSAIQSPARSLGEGQDFQAGGESPLDALEAAGPSTASGGALSSFPGSDDPLASPPDDAPAPDRPCPRRWARRRLLLHFRLRRPLSIGQNPTVAGDFQAPAPATGDNRAVASVGDPLPESPLPAPQTTAGEGTESPPGDDMAADPSTPTGPVSRQSGSGRSLTLDLNLTDREEVVADATSSVATLAETTAKGVAQSVAESVVDERISEQTTLECMRSSQRDAASGFF